MICTMISLIIDLCLIFACWKLHKRPPVTNLTIRQYNPKPLQGQIDRLKVKVAISEKFAERAHSAANAASLGVVALQKTLHVPRPLTKSQANSNKLAKKQIDSLFNEQSGFDWMRPLLSDEENEILDNLEKEKSKAQ